MSSEASSLREQGLETIKVAAIQIPFIPVYIRPNYNTLSEPDGGINFWIVGDEKKNISTLSSILKDIETDTLESLKTDYIDWFVSTIEDILHSICYRENPDIILFPEYSLPIELSNELKNLLIKYSEKRCIVGGIGSVSEDGDRKPNLFVVINDKKLQFGEKAVLSPYEHELKDIEEGNGPFFYPLTLYPGGNKKHVFSLVLMCSDFIASGYDPTLWGKINKELEKRIESGEIDCQNIKEVDDKIGIVFVPALTTKGGLKDMQSYRVHVGRKWRIVVLANCSFFGGTQIHYPPYDINGLKNGLSTPLNQGMSGCIIAEMPYPPRQEIKPKSKPFRRDGGGITSKLGCKTYNILFKNENNEIEESMIQVDTENFLELITNRLNIAITYATISTIGWLQSSDKDRTIKTLNLWKKLQKTIADSTSQRTITHKDIPNLIMPYLDRLIFTEDQYTPMVEVLREVLKTQKECTDCLRKIEKCISDGKCGVFPLHYLLKNKKGV